MEAGHGNHWSMKYSIGVLRGAITALGLVVCACASVGVGNTTVLANFPIVFGEPPTVIVVPITLGGAEYPFIVDTGSTVTVYDETLRPRLGQPVTTHIAGMGAGKARLQMFRAPEARLGKLELPTGGLVGCADLSAVRDVVRSLSGQEVYGILGMDFLKDYVLQIDFEEKRLAIIEPGASPRRWGQGFPIEYASGGIPVLAATLSNDVQARFLVDTGDAGTGDIEAELFERLRAQGSLVVTGLVQCATGSGYRETPEGRLDRLTLGPYRHEGLKLFQSHWNGLGLGYLSHYIVTFDFPNGILYLKRPSGPSPTSYRS